MDIAGRQLNLHVQYAHVYYTCMSTLCYHMWRKLVHEPDCCYGIRCVPKKVLQASMELGPKCPYERCANFRACYLQASMELAPEDVSLYERSPHVRGCYVEASMELGPEDVSPLERCPHFRGCYVQASMELGPEDVSPLERCPHFRGCYVQASMELGPEDVSPLERCPHFRGVKYRLHGGYCWWILLVVMQ